MKVEILQRGGYLLANGIVETVDAPLILVVCRHGIELLVTRPQTKNIPTCMSLVPILMLQLIVFCLMCVSCVVAF
jgi:hypothetical protein